MRSAIAFILAYLFHSEVIAQNGYYITLQGDTVAVDINIPKTFVGGEDFEKLFKEVKVLYPNGGQKTYKPDEITGFFFLYKKKEYVFESQRRARYQLITNKLSKVPAFLIKIEQGKNGAAYYRFENATDEGNLPIIENYTFIRSTDEQLLFLQNGDGSKSFRKKLKQFYAFAPNVEKSIRKKFRNHKKMRRDIQNFMLAINKA